MKITTLYAHAFHPAKFFTTQETAREGNVYAFVTGYPAVELDNGTFRLIDSDAIVAADREVTLFESTHGTGIGAFGGHPWIGTGRFFLSLEEARADAKATRGKHIFHHVWVSTAIPQPDGSYLRVKEGDIVRLWEPPAAPVPCASAQALWGLYTFEKSAPYRSWLRKLGPDGEVRHGIRLTADTIRFSKGTEAVQLRNRVPALHGFTVAEIPENPIPEGATQATPESVEKPTMADVIEGVHKAKMSAYAALSKVVKQRREIAKAIEQGFVSMYGPAGCGKTLVSSVPAVPESEVSGAQDDFFAGLKGVELKLKLTEDTTGQAFVDKILETDHDRRVREHLAKWDAFQKQRETKARLIESRIARCGQQVKSILSLPAGPERAEAKLKLISEISKL